MVVLMLSPFSSSVAIVSLALSFPLRSAIRISVSRQTKLQIVLPARALFPLLRQVLLDRIELPAGPDTRKFQEAPDLPVLDYSKDHIRKGLFPPLSLLKLRIRLLRERYDLGHDCMHMRMHISNLLFDLRRSQSRCPIS